MAEIKSSIEIAMERAAALEGRASDEAKDEGEKHGKAAARRLLDDDVDAAAMAELIQARPENQRSYALKAAVELLLEALMSGDDRTLDGLEALPLSAGKVEALVEAARGRFEAAGELYTKLAGEMSQDLAAMGISGSAVSPNPIANPELQARMRQALSGHMGRMQEAAEALFDTLK